MNSEKERDRLSKEAFKKDGLQAPDIAYYLLIFLPLLTGIAGYYFWTQTIVNRPEIPPERLNPLFWSSIVLIGGSELGILFKNGR